MTQVPHSPSVNVIVIGGSVRAASQALQRAGLRVAVIDRFGDDDLVGQRLESPGDWTSPQFLQQTWPRLVEECQAKAWVYTGGLENTPRLLESLSNHLTLLGNSANVVSEVRSPHRLSHALLEHDFPSAWTFDRHPPAAWDAWILKPKQSTGGLQVHRLRSTEPELIRNWQDWISAGGSIQREIKGRELGASFLATRCDQAANSKASNCRFIGACRPLSCQRELNAPPFAYCGSMGPVLLPSRLRLEVERLGQVLAGVFRLSGLFGVDLIFDGDRCWTLEVNPRYTASMELLERSKAWPLMRAHLASCDPVGSQMLKSHDGPCEPHLSEVSHPQGRRATSQLFGKAIQYVPPGKAWVAGESFVALAREANNQQAWPVIADIPRTGTILAPGEPAFTVYENSSPDSHYSSEANDDRKTAAIEDQVQQRLLESARRWWRLLAEHSRVQSIDGDR